MVGVVIKDTQQVRNCIWLDLPNNFMTNLTIANICLLTPHKNGNMIICGLMNSSIKVFKTLIPITYVVFTYKN